MSRMKIASSTKGTDTTIAYMRRKSIISACVLSGLMNIPGSERPIESDRKFTSTQIKVTGVRCSFLNQLSVTLLPLLSSMSPLPPQSKEPSRQT